MEIKELYQEIILDAKKIRETKVSVKVITTMQRHNPLCGDRVHIYINLDKEKNIKGLSFEGEGCANFTGISIDELTDTLKGRDLQFTKK